jgi:hypothetical protein
MAAGQTLTIGPAVGAYPGQLHQRSWTVVFRDVARPRRVTVDGDDARWHYDESSRTLTVRTPESSVARAVNIDLLSVR